MTLAICTVLCVVFYEGMRISLDREVDAFLDGENHEFIDILRFERPGTRFTREDRAAYQSLVERLHQEVVFRLFDANGQVALASNPGIRLPVVDHGRAVDAGADGEGEAIFVTVQAPGHDHPFRLCARWATLPGGGNYLAEIAYPLDDRDAALARFRRLCFSVVGLGAGLSVLCGLLLAGRTLRPVRRMTETARSIGSGTLAERLPRAHNGDELDNLAAVLNAMLARLEHQFLDVQRFTADAAHELRSPLSALRGTMEVALRHEPERDELRRVLEESIEHLDRLTKTTNDLLLLARADAGRDFLQTAPLALAEVVRDVGDFYSVLASERGVRLTLDATGSVQMWGDAARLRQVAGNLIDNAVRHTPPGGVVRVVVEDGGANAILWVEDTGPGIDPEHLPHLFERFYRADPGRARHDGGSGLGLAICRSIVEAHGGRIDAASTVGVGTIMTVLLPRNLPTGGEGVPKENSPR